MALSGKHVEELMKKWDKDTKVGGETDFQIYRFKPRRVAGSVSVG